MKMVADIRMGFEAVRRGATKTQAEAPSKRQQKLNDLLKIIAELRHEADTGQLSDDDLENSRDYLIEQAMNLWPDGKGAGSRELAITIRGIDDPSMVLLKDAITDYLREKKTHVTKRTLRSKERRLQAFQKWLRDDLYLLKDVDRRVAGNYTQTFMRRIAAGDLSPETARDTLANLSAFCNWCMVRGRLDTNPYSGQARTISSSTRGTTEKSRRVWTEDELLQFHSVVPPSSKAWLLATLSMYTGARVSEVCALKVKDVVEGCLRVTEGKTRSASRDIPIHPVIQPLVGRLSTTSPDGYLIPGLTKGGPDDTRGEYLQVKLRKIIRDKVGIKDKRVVPHTLRNGFITMLERAGVPVHEMQLLVGHKRGSVTLDVYSEGAGLERLRDAVRKVSFGPVDEVVAGRIGELVS